MTARIPSLAAALGLARSIRVYHLDRARHRRMDALYRQFMTPGEVAFDLGAHVGDRISSFRRLGARVVAIEPQPGPAWVCRLLHGRDRDVTLLQVAVGASSGSLTLRVNTRNPTVTTGSDDFRRAADGAAGWEGQRWDQELVVPMVTLDELIRDHGTPSFLKIDVEGFEEQVLLGLSQPVPNLSFEFTTIQRDVALACLNRLAALGPYRFDLALGESHRLHFGDWVEGPQLADYLAGLPHAANSGDIYARLA
jgi:FkbM family methyltransferase